MIKKKNLLEIFTLLILIILSALFYELNSINRQKEELIKFENLFYKLETVNSNINSYIFGEKRVYNLDNINSEIKKFEKIIYKIDKSKLYPPFKKEVENIKKTFYTKKSLIEKYKAYNAINISTVVYLLDLFNKIEKTCKDKKILNRLNYYLQELFRLYLGLKNGFSVIKPLKTENEYVKLFINNVLSTKEKLLKIQKIKYDIKKLNLQKKIETTLKKYNSYSLHILKKQKTLIKSTIFFIYSLILILFFLFWKNYLLRKNLYFYKLAVEKSDNSVLLISKNLEIIYANNSFVKNSGYTLKELKTLGVFSYLKNSIEKSEYNLLKEAFVNKKFFKKVIKTFTKEKQEKYEKIILQPITEEKNFLGFLFIKLDITEEIEQKNRVEFLAYHDHLTKLKNREKLKKDLSTLIKNHRNFYLFMIDLDKFKYINDVFSHHTGDMVLIKVAEILSKITNYSYRIGGDEFVLLIFEKEFEKIAEDILEKLRIIEIDNKTFEIEASIAIVEYNKDMDIISLLKFADIALLEAKKRGNCYQIFDEFLYKKSERTIKIMQKLPKAIKEKSFYVVYQPKYEIETKKIYSLEALVRWKDEELGEIYPNEFIPIAEEKNLIDKIDMFVLEKACEDIKLFRKYCKGLKNISVNLSGVEMVKKDLEPKIKEILEKNNTDFSDIDFEVTESFLIANVDYSAEILRNLKKNNCNISIDDFGTGYSSLYYILKMPFDTLKIDKSFIEDIDSNKTAQKMLETIVVFAKNFSLDIVAEGVENKNQEKILKDIGVKKAQGYYFSKPLKKDELIEFFKKND